MDRQAGKENHADLQAVAKRVVWFVAPVAIDSEHLEIILDTTGITCAVSEAHQIRWATLRSISPRNCKVQGTPSCETRPIRIRESGE